MILAALVLALGAAEVTLPAVGQLSPAAAGELVLAGREHGPVRQVIRLPQQGMDPPGLIRVELVEAATTTTEGCVRQRWTAFFTYGAGQGADDARLTDAQESTEVSRVLAGPCPDSGYVHLNPDVAPSEGLAALALLDAVAIGRNKTELTCHDATDSALCLSSPTIRRELARLRPWAVVKEDGVMAVWLGVQGGAVTQVRFETGLRKRVSVSRTYPAPF